jgi:hypothetical protein
MASRRDACEHTPTRESGEFAAPLKQVAPGRRLTPGDGDEKEEEKRNRCRAFQL